MDRRVTAFSLGKYGFMVSEKEILTKGDTLHRLSFPATAGEHLLFPGEGSGAVEPDLRTDQDG